MSLNGGGQRPEVHAIGADADGAAPAAGAERQDLVEAVEQAGPLASSRSAIRVAADRRRSPARSAIGANGLSA